MHRTNTPLCLLAALCLLSAGARAEDPPASRFGTADGPAGMLRSENHYLPTDVTFRANGEPLAVGISRVSLDAPGGIAEAEHARAPDDASDRRHTTSLHLADGRTIRVHVMTSPGRMELRVEGGQHDDTLMLHLSGCDRAVWPGGSGFRAARLVAGDGPVLSGRATALQDRRSQDGLVLVGPSRARIRPSPDGARVGLPLGSAEGDVFAIARFRGDAMLAIEQAAPDAKARAGRRPEEDAAREPRDPPGIPRDEWADAPQPPNEWQWWSGTERAFRPLLADPREARVRLGWLYDAHAEKFFTAGLGGELVVARRELGPEEELTFGLRGLIISRLNSCRSSFPMYNTDFFGGVSAGYRRGDDAFELYLYHESSHLGDDVPAISPVRKIEFSREALRLLWSHDFGDLRVYGGPTLNLRAEPEEIECSPTLQLGGEYRWSAFGRPFYAAADAQSREHNDWRVNIAAQLGMELGKDLPERHRPRVFVEFFNGFSEMGQFWDEREAHCMIGLGSDF